MKIAIIGTGYVGVTTGACLAFLGHNVTCVDTDANKVAMLNGGRTPIHEPHLSELLATARANIQFTTSHAEAVPGADVVMVAVGTPPSQDGSPNLRYVLEAARAVGKNLRGAFTVIVNKSTVPIGCGNWVDSIVRESYEAANPAGGSQFSIASCPEFLREGAAISDTLYADRVVIGTTEERAAVILTELYRPVLEQSFRAPEFAPRPVALQSVPLVSTDLASAELIKYAANAFLALKISYVNEIGQLAGCVGADIRDVAKGIGLDSRIGQRFLQPGIGWGGSCFGKDTAALVATASEYGLDMRVVRAARDVNERMRDLVLTRLLGELKILKGKTVALLGVAFKPGTDDLRDAPAIDIASKLIDRGAKVLVHDPVALNRLRTEHGLLPVVCCPTVEAAATNADAIVLVTEWEEYLSLDWGRIGELMRTRVILDGREVLSPERLRDCGFRYMTLTRDVVRPDAAATTAGDISMKRPAEQLNRHPIDVLSTR